MLRAHTALYGAAIALDRLLALLLLPLLTRAIGAQDYGAWTQTLVGAGLLMPLVLFAFPTTVVRFFAGDAMAASRRRGFVQLGAIALGLLALAAALALPWREPLARLAWGDPARQALVPGLLGVLAADAGIEFANAWLRAAGRIGLISAALVLRSGLRYAVVWALVADGGVPLAQWLLPYALSQAALALGLLAASAWLVWRPARAAPTDMSAAPAPTLRTLLAFSAPLVALALFSALTASFDRFLLVRWLGLDGVAVYAAAMSLCMVPAVFYSVLGFTLFPALARHWNEGRRDEAARLTARALQVYLFLCLPVALLIGLTGPLLLPLLATADYRAPAPVFLWLGVSVAAFGLYQILLYPLLLDGRSGQVLRLAVAAAALNAALNLGLTPRLGLVGAAVSAALANGLMVAVAARLAARVVGARLGWGLLWPIAWRAGLAALPLALPLALGAPTGPAPLAALTLLCGALYLTLDWARPGSLARQLWPR